MAIKILKEGKSPQEKTYTTSCKRCGSKFSYQSVDIFPDQRDGDYVKCPTKCCGAFINHADSKQGFTAFDE